MYFNPDTTKAILAATNLTPIIIYESGNYLTIACHNASARAGWWNDLHTGKPMIHEPRVVSEKLMLIVSEVAEAMEGHRKNLPDDKLPHHSMLAVELADAAIRIFDLAGALNIPLGNIILEKLTYNATRPDHKPENRKAPGGKTF